MLPYSKDLGAGLYDKILEIAQMEPGPFALQVTDQQATSAALYATGQWPDNPLREATIWFTQGQVHIVARLVKVTPMTLNIRLSGRLETKGGWPSLTVDTAAIGSIRLPEFVRSWIGQIATETVRDSGIPHRFYRLDAREGRFLVEGEVLSAHASP